MYAFGLPPFPSRCGCPLSMAPMGKMSEWTRSWAKRSLAEWAKNFRSNHFFKSDLIEWSQSGKKSFSHVWLYFWQCSEQGKRIINDNGAVFRTSSQCHPAPAFISSRQTASLPYRARNQYLNVVWLSAYVKLIDQSLISTNNSHVRF